MSTRIFSHAARCPDCGRVIVSTNGTYYCPECGIVFRAPTV